MGLREQAVSSVGWTMFARLVRQGFGFILSVLLMRLLSPDAYGLIGMALVFIGFANIFKEFGFGSALVQRSQLTSSHYVSTFYLNIGIGIGLTTIFILIAPLLSSFYGEAKLIKILQVLSFNFVIASIGIVPKSVLQRKMRFDLLSKIEIITAVLTGFIAVGFAFLGFGVWALVIQSLTMNFFSTVLYMIFTKWYPKWIFSWRAITQLWAFSANLTGFKVINYGARRSDDLLIGKYMGSANLGVYTRAYTLMLLPIKQVISVISQVMFSALSKMQREKDRVKRVYLNAMQILAFITFPLMVGLFIVAKPFVLVLFGEKWSGVIPLIQILTWVGVIQTLCNPVGWIYQSQGKTDWMFWWGIFGSGTLVIAIVMGVWWGGTVKSVAIAYAFANLIIAYPCIAIPGSLINMDFVEVVKVVMPAFFISLMMALTVFGSSYLLVNVDLSIKLNIEVLVGIFSYMGLAYIFNLKAFNKIKKIIYKYLLSIKVKNLTK